MIELSRVVVAVMLPLLVASSASAQDDTVIRETLANCASLGDDAERLLCYDGLAQLMSLRTSEDGAATPQPPALEAAATEGPAPITDDVGLVPEEDDLPQYAVRVTGCRETARGQQLFFFLENGQVWKQSDYRRLRIKDCELDGVIVKGGFGYRLELPALDRSVRVARVR